MNCHPELTGGHPEFISGSDFDNFEKTLKPALPSGRQVQGDKGN
jgi:hypothetical protein